MSNDRQEGDAEQDNSQPRGQLIPFSKTVNPWTLSIYQSIRNRNTRESIQGIDDIDIPDLRSNPLFYSRRHSHNSSSPLDLHSFGESLSRRQNAPNNLSPRLSIPFHSSRQQLPRSPTTDSRRTLMSATPSNSPNSPARLARTILWTGENIVDAGPQLSPVPSLSRLSLEHDVEQSVQSHSSSTRPLVPNFRPPDDPPPNEPNESIPSSSSDEEANEDRLKWREIALAFLLDTVPRGIYLCCHLGIPVLYYSRVERIFIEAELSLGEIKDMALRSTAGESRSFDIYLVEVGYDQYLDSPNELLPPSYRRLKSSWERLVDNLLMEWKIFNLVSALLVTGIFSMLQINGMTSDPIANYIAIWSLICAAMSLLYGCSYSIQFKPMRKAHQAAEWAVEARSNQSIFWNVWVLLALPCSWLVWSLSLFLACILYLVWKPPGSSPSSMLTSIELCFRVFLCSVLGIGLLYFILIFKTFYQYGLAMDQAWKRRVDNFIAHGNALPLVHSLQIRNNRNLQSPRTQPSMLLPSPTAPTSEPLSIGTIGAPNAIDSVSSPSSSSALQSPITFSTPRRSAWRSVPSPIALPSSESWIGLNELRRPTPPANASSDSLSSSTDVDVQISVLPPSQPASPKSLGSPLAQSAPLFALHHTEVEFKASLSAYPSPPSPSDSDTPLDVSIHHGPVMISSEDMVSSTLFSRSPPVPNLRSSRTGETNHDVLFEEGNRSSRSPPIGRANSPTVHAEACSSSIDFTRGNLRTETEGESPGESQDIGTNFWEIRQDPWLQGTFQLIDRLTDTYHLKLL